VSLAILFLLLMASTCFGHYYAHHRVFATMQLNYHISRFVLGFLCVGGWVRFGWCSIRAAGWSSFLGVVRFLFSWV